MTMDTYTYKTVDGVALPADVHRPAVPGTAGFQPAAAPQAPAVPSRHPVLVWLHGGALIAGGRDNLDPRHLAAYLSAGYLVVAPDYRLAPETKLPEIAADLCDVFAWVRDRGPELFGADPARIAAVGHSAGGYLTLLAGQRVTPRLQALVSFYGYGDILGDWYALPDPFYREQPLVPEEEARAAVGESVCLRSGWEPRGRFYLYCRQQGRWPQEVGGLDEEALHAYCPLGHLTPDYPPTLLLHGTADTDVPYAQSEQMAEALAGAGVPHQFLTIEGGPHGFDRGSDARTLAAFACVLGFLREHLG